MIRPWPRSLGALAGFIFVALFVVVPEGRKLGWPHEALRYFAEMALMSGTAGAIAGWLLVTMRNRLMIQR
jgi:hypothetical protein